METNTLDIIKEKYSGLNKAQKLVAQYILDMPGKAVNMNISELSNAVGVSESTIFRFASNLGYTGFQQFKINLARSITRPLHNIHSEVSAGEESYIIMQKLYSGYSFSLQETIKLNSDESFQIAVDKLKKANKVYLFGMGGSFSFARDAEHKFIRNGLDCVSNSDIHWINMNIALAKKNDVVIIFSSSGKNKDLLDAIDLAKDRGLFVVSITANPDSIIAKNSDISLISFGREYSIRSEAFEARISTLFIIDTLYLLLATRDEKSEKLTLDNLFKIRETISKRRF